MPSNVHTVAGSFKSTKNHANPSIFAAIFSKPLRFCTISQQDRNAGLAVVYKRHFNTRSHLFTHEDLIPQDTRCPLLLPPTITL